MTELELRMSIDLENEPLAVVENNAEQVSETVEQGQRGDARVLPWLERACGVLVARHRRSTALERHCREVLEAARGNPNAVYVEEQG